MGATDNNGFQIHMSVRDYECDMEGIVNNAVYLNYLEHARHEYLRSLGVDFAEITRQEVHPVVVRAELDYRQSLRSGDQFVVAVAVERVSRLRLAFMQEIHRVPQAGGTAAQPAAAGSESPGADGPAGAVTCIVQARIITAAVSSSGRPVPPEEIHPRMAEILSLGDPS